MSIRRRVRAVPVVKLKACPSEEGSGEALRRVGPALAVTAMRSAEEGPPLAGRYLGASRRWF